MSETDAFDQERLDSEDIESLNTLRRTFENMSMGNRSQVDGELVFASFQDVPMTMCL